MLKELALQELKVKKGEKKHMTTTTVTYQRTEYPRPQFQRKSWINLNGTWKFAFDDQNIGEKGLWHQKPSFSTDIQVPFTYETKASGIGEEDFHPYVWYQRLLEIPKEEAGKRVILRFQASDYLTKVWVNGNYIGDHAGGNAAFSFDITNEIDNTKKNELVVKVEDSQSCYQPRGKQRWTDENFGCWYVQNTGIWQTVWLELLNDESIENVKITPKLDTNSVVFDYKLNGLINEKLSLETTIGFDGNKVKQFSINPDRSNMHLEVDLVSELYEWKVKYWTPEHPNLYDVTFRLYAGGELVDEVNSYFGMRKISIKDGQVLDRKSVV